MICWNFVTSEGIAGILNTYVFIFVWSSRSSTEKKSVYKLMDQDNALTERLATSPESLKINHFTVGPVFSIFNPTLLQLWNLSAYIFHTARYLIVASTI